MNLNFIHIYVHGYTHFQKLQESEVLRETSSTLRTLRNSAVQASLGLVIGHSVYLYKQFVPYRKHNIRQGDQPFNTVHGVVAVYCGKNTERLLFGHSTEALVMAARTGLLVKISNQCTHFGKYLFHVTFIIVRLVLLFLARKLPASHPVPNTPMVPPPSQSFQENTGICRVSRCMSHFSCQ